VIATTTASAGARKTSRAAAVRVIQSEGGNSALDSGIRRARQ